MTSVVRILFVTALLSIESSHALATVPGPIYGDPATHASSPARVAAPVNYGMALGATALLMIACRSQQRQWPWLAIGTFAFGMMAAGFGCFAGVWQFGLLIGGYAIACLCGYIQSRKPKRGRLNPQLRRQLRSRSWEESRMSRMFGSIE